MIHEKVKASAKAGVSITGLATVIAWIAEQSGLQMPLPVAVSIAGITVNVVNFVAGYLKAG